MHYNKPPLILTDTSITDALGTIELKELPEPQPKCAVRLKGTTPLVERLWRIALSDIEKNVVKTPDGCYLGAGKSFGVTVYTRDISYSGILGVNALYPDLMLNSIRFTRKMRLEQSFRVALGYCVKEIDVPWVEENISEREYLQKYHTNSYTRRTDDVVWMWCAADLIKRQGARQEWAWLFDTGKEFFRRFYQPFFDKRDGLYFGQATFVDIHFTDYKATGYPIEWEIPDCVLIKSLSTNCLYVMGLDAMAVAAAKLGFHAEAQEWETAREQLKGAIRQHLRRPDGTLAYFRERHGTLQKRRDALGSALAVLTGIVDGEDGRKALSDYPITDAGVPLLHPFLTVDNWYHNNSSWPFVDTFFIKALEMSDGQERGALNTALLARTCIDDGTFHEVTDYRTKRVKGSASQLWTAAAFIDTCLRSGLVRGFSLK